jgi:hypothetical protein
MAKDMGDDLQRGIDFVRAMKSSSWMITTQSIARFLKRLFPLAGH